MKIWELIKEVITHYAKEFWKKRLGRSWQENLFFIPLVAAIVILIIIIL